MSAGFTPLPPSPAGSGRSPGWPIEQVGKLLGLRRYEEAERLCQAALQKDPLDASAMHFLGLIAKERGQTAEAERLMRRSIELQPDEPAFHNNFGNLLRNKNELATAEQSYRRALALNPKYVGAHFNLGIVLKNLGRSEEARAEFEAALKFKPDYAEALTQLGILLKEAQNPEEAILNLEKAIALKPDYFDAHYYRGITLASLARTDEAIASLQAALALKPSSSEAAYALGGALQFAGRDEEALAAYWKSIEAKPSFTRAHYDYNSLAWTMGRKDLYLKSFAYARQHEGETPSLLIAEANIRMRFAKHEQAEILLRRAHELAPDRADIIGGIGRALTGQGRFAESLSYFEDALLKDPKNIALHHELAISYLRNHQAGEARRVLESALELDPNEQLTIGGLCLAYRELGDSRYETLVDPEKHVKVFEIALPAGFTDAKVFNLALAQELEGLHTRKVEPFDQTLRGGTQTFGNLFTKAPRLVAYARDAIAECVARYIREMPDDARHPLFRRKDEKFTFSGSWSCRLRSSGYHTNHVHPMGWISSAYYVHVPEETEDERQHQGWLKFGESHLNLGERDRPHRYVRPLVGQLALFPSYYWHGTVPFTSRDNRVTIAFDVVPGEVKLGDSGIRTY